MYQHKSKDELHAMLGQVRTELGKLRFSSKDPSQPLNPSDVAKLKKQVAQIMTALNSKKN